MSEEIDRKKPIPFPISIDEIETLAQFYPSPYSILFRISYLYGSRIGEALGVRADDFKIETDNYGREVLTVRLMTEKNKKTPMRVLPAIISGEKLTNFQKEEAVITKKVLEELPGEGERLVFPGISRQLAHYYFSKQAINIRALLLAEKKIIELEAFKLHPHYLRHCRLTHLVEEYAYDHIKLMQFAGWTDVRPASVYLQLDWHNLADAMKPTNWLDGYGGSV